MKKKQTLDEFLDPARVARAGMGEEEWQKYVNELRQRQYESILSYKKVMDDYKESAECKARDKLEEELRRLKVDPVISKSETCGEILEAFLHCIVYGWSFSDSARVLQPIGDEFERLKLVGMAASKHGKSNKAKEWVQAEWRIYKTEYNGNKSAFSRDYVRRCLNEYEVKVTEKQMREVWLKDPPSASKPDGMPANG